MKLYSAIILSLAVTAATQANAEDVSFPKIDAGVIPVLVSVNNSGQVTHISTAQSLRPGYARLLRSNVDETLTASGKNAEGVRQQYVLQMKLDNKPLEDGDFAVFFRPLNVSSIHAANWQWRNEGSRYRLVQRVSGLPGHGSEDQAMRAEFQMSGPVTY